MRWIAFVTLAALASGCRWEMSGPPLETGDTQEPNVTVLMGASVIATDSAVLIDGGRHIDYGDGPFGLLSDHFTDYGYGGAYEVVNDALTEESWYMDVGRRIVTAVRADTTFTRALDFGEVALEGMPAGHFESDSARVIETPDGVRVYENLLLDRLSIYIVRLNRDGSTVTFVHAPFYEDMVAGAAVELTASGSDDIEPTSASLTMDAGARVVSLWNGKDLAFQVEKQLLDTHEPLIVELDRPLDPDWTILHFFYIQPPPYDMNPDSVRAASAVFMLDEQTDRVVIPAFALDQIASHLPVPDGQFMLRIYEYGVMENALRIVRSDGITEDLTGIQSNGFSVTVRVRR